jgi:hypothetical protein
MLAYHHQVIGSTSHTFLWAAYGTPESAYYAGIKIFNSLPSNLRSLMNKQTQFKGALKMYLNTHLFYSVEKFLMFKNDSEYVQKFFPTVSCMEQNMCIFYVKLFYVNFTVFWKRICLWFITLCLLFLFCSFCIYLYVMYLHDLVHILLLSLQT